MAPAGAAEASDVPKATSAARESEKVADTAAPLGNPAMWWNMLQDQFNQAVNTALASEKPPTKLKPASSKVASEKSQTSKPTKVAATRKAVAPRAKKVAKTPAKQA